MQRKRCMISFSRATLQHRELVSFDHISSKRAAFALFQTVLPRASRIACESAACVSSRERNSIPWPGIFEKGLERIRRYRFDRFLEFDGNTSVACNTISTQVHNHRRVSSLRKCPYSLTKGKPRRFSICRACNLLNDLCNLVHSFHAAPRCRPAFDKGEQPRV